MAAGRSGYGNRPNGPSACSGARRREAERGVGKVEQLLRPLPPVKAQISTDRLAIMRALAGFRDHQPLGHATGGSHAAAFCSPAGAILRVREDVDRHNALDKLSRCARQRRDRFSDGLLPAFRAMQLRTRRKSGSLRLFDAVKGIESSL